MLNKARTATSTVGWIFLTALKANGIVLLRGGKPGCHVQRHLEEAEQHILELEQETPGFEFEFEI